MIPIANLFLIDEIGPILGPPFRNSIGTTHPQAIQTGRPPMSSEAKVVNSENVQARLTPRPAHKKPVDLGMKPFRKVP